ncbi:MAG TPA: NAD(P)H-hydrate dehydratase [Mycobacteriales bacterium]|nr:NAD(P)H-hydrate dehydratase [Mycobacteriales bacterium]
MRPVYTAEEIRGLERAAMTSSRGAERATEAELIRRASWAVAHRAADLMGGTYGRRVLVACGPGHNGADALWAGVHLARRGAAVSACRLRPDDADGQSRDAAAALALAGGRLIDGPAPAAFDVAIDGLTGLGFAPRAGTEDSRLASLAGELRASSAVVVAVDLPSGVAADTGCAADWAVRADVTVTFGALKIGLVVGRGADLAGVVEVVDIGLGALPTASTRILDADDVAGMLPAVHAASTKYSRGVVGVVAGGPAYVGAAVLCAGGALRAGAGMVRLHAHPATVEVVRARWPEVVGVELDPEAVRQDEKVDTWVVGPGLGTDDDATDVVQAVLSSSPPVVVDADAITIVARHPALLSGRLGATVLTPHAGEFRRLAGGSAEEIAGDPLAAARRAAAELHAWVLLKGMRTVVASPDGDALINPTGTPWLATAGTGDVLAGAIGTLLAAGLRPQEAAGGAAWLHGLAARLACGGAPLVAMDVVDWWPHAVRQVQRQAG